MKALVVPFLLFASCTRSHPNDTVISFAGLCCIQFNMKSWVPPQKSGCVDLYESWTCTNRLPTVPRFKWSRFLLSLRSSKACFSALENRQKGYSDLPFRNNVSERGRCRSVDPIPQMYQECFALEMHNIYRRQHGVRELILDSSLSISAQNYANDLVRRNQFRHSDSNDEYGENLAFFRFDTVPNEKTAIAMSIYLWYNEIADFSFDHPKLSVRTGHFSQMIWSDNFAMGIGTAYNVIKCAYIVVVHYKPGGNINVTEQILRNIPPPMNI